MDDPEFFECELLTVSREQAELAASEVSGCEACSESAEIPFDWVIADAMTVPAWSNSSSRNRRGVRFAMLRSAKRPSWIVAGLR
jgi:hypothetical protein